MVAETACVASFLVFICHLNSISAALSLPRSFLVEGRARTLSVCACRCFCFAEHLLTSRLLSMYVAPSARVASWCAHVHILFRASTLFIAFLFFSHFRDGFMWHSMPFLQVVCISVVCTCYCGHETRLHCTYSELKSGFFLTMCCHQIVLPANRGNGLQVSSVLARRDGKLCLDLTFLNQSPTSISNFLFQLNPQNSFGIVLDGPIKVLCAFPPFLSLSATLLMRCDNSNCPSSPIMTSMRMYPVSR